MLHLGHTAPQSHRETPPLRLPPIKTSYLTGVTSIGGYSKNGSQSSPLSLARGARLKASLQMTTSTTSSPNPARADPCSVPCSPTTYADIGVLGKDSIDEVMPSCTLDGLQVQLSTIGPVSPALSSCPSSPFVPDSSIARNFPWIFEEPRQKALGWINRQSSFDSNSLSGEKGKSSFDSTRRNILGRGRAFSESATGLPARLSHWKSTPLSRLGAKQRIGNLTDVLDPIIDCTQESETDGAQSKRASSWDIVASKDGSSNISQDHFVEDDARECCETDARDSSDCTGAPLTFSVLRDQSEGSFSLTQSEVDNLQYSDLEEQCSRALKDRLQSSKARRIGRRDRIFLILSASEALRLRLIRSKSEQLSCNLALIESWTTSISTTMQELLIKDSFRETSLREGEIRLFVLERGQSLPSHNCASRDFWSGWSNLPAIAGDYKSLSILINSGAAPVVQRSSVSRKSESLRVSSPVSRTSLSLDTSEHPRSLRIVTEEGCLKPISDMEKDEKSDEKEGESGTSPSHSLLSFQSSHFSSETSPEERPKEATWNTKISLLPGKRRKRGVRIPMLTGTALALRAGNASCFKSDTVSPRVTSVILHTRRGRRQSCHPNSPAHAKTTSPPWRKKRRDMVVETASPFSSSRTGFGGSFKRSNQALKRAAGYFGGRTSISVKTSQPPTPTTASISLAEMCSHLPESSVENLLCDQPRIPDDSSDWRDTIAEFTVDQDAREIIGIQSSEKASLSSKRMGWLGNGSRVSSIRESFDLENEPQEIEIGPTTERQTIILEDTFGRKAIVEELAEELYEAPKKAPRRSESITSLFKTTLASLASSPQKSRQMKQGRSGNALRMQVKRLTRSKSDEWSSRPDLQVDINSVRKPANVASMSLYSMSSVDALEVSPLTGATTIDDSPCLTDASTVLNLSPSDKNLLTPPLSSPHRLGSNSTQFPRPARKRESGLFQLQSMSTYGSLYRSQSVSTMSEGWICSNEDLEPEVRDCVSSLSGRIGDDRSLSFKRRNVDLTSLNEETRDSISIDSTATTILSHRGITPGSAPLLQQCSSKDRLRLLSNGSNSNLKTCNRVSPA